MAEVAISTEGLVKRYGRNRGLAGLDLEVRRGEVYGFLGPTGPARPPPSGCCWTSSDPPEGGLPCWAWIPGATAWRCGAGSGI